MQDTLLLDRIDQANALLQPARLDVLRQLAEPRSCPQVAAALGLTTSRVHYHVKVLEKAGLVERVAERRVRAVVEGVYQAAARSYWLSASSAASGAPVRPARSQATSTSSALPRSSRPTWAASPRPRRRSASRPRSTYPLTGGRSSWPRLRPP